MRFNRRLCNISIILQFTLHSSLFQLPSGSPENRTQRDSVIGRVWATSPRLPFDCGFVIADCGLKKSTNPQSEICNPQSKRWAGRRSNPRLLVFSQALYRLSYQPNKKTRCRGDTGFRECRKFPSSVTSATAARAAYSPVDRRNYLCSFVRI